MVGFDQLDETQKQELQSLIDGLRGERPDWAPLLFLAGRHAEKMEEPGRALYYYRQAFAKGRSLARAPCNDCSCCWMTRDARRRLERMLAQLSSEQVTSPFLDAMAVELAVKAKDLKGALQLARKNAGRHPENLEARITLASRCVPR